MSSVALVARHIESRDPAHIGATNGLILQRPMGITLLGVYLQRLTVNTYVNCVIIPLCMPVERIYFVQGNPLGFNYGRYPSPQRQEGWNFDDGQQISDLEELILKKLLPAWEELSDPQNCIDHFMQMAPGHRTAEDCILSKDYDRLAAQLEDWYHKSVRKLRLTKFASPLLYQSR